MMRPVISTAPTSLDRDTGALLRACAARERRLLLVRLGGIALLLATLGTIVVGLLDRVIAIPPLAGWTLLSALLGSIVLLLGRPIWRWLRRDDRPVWLARRIERRVPELGERLLTLESARSAGSEAFIDRLGAEVSHLLRGRSAGGLVSSRPALLAWRLAGISVVVLVALMVAGVVRADALARLWTPWRVDHRAAAIVLLIEPGNTRVLQGQPLRVSVRAGGLDRTVVPVIRWSIDGGRWASSAMTRSGDEQFAFVFQSLDRPMRYRVAAGTTESTEHRVDVAHRPAVAVMEAEVTYPAHLQRPPLRVTLDEPRLEMPAGSTLRLRITATEPLASAVVEAGGRRLAASATDAPETVEISLPVDRDGAWQIELMSRDGIPSARLAPVQLRAIADAPPVARLPERTLRATPASTVLLPYQAGDDLSLVSIVLQIERRGSRLPDQPVPAVGDPRLQSGVIELDLPALGVRIGDELICRLEPRDIAGQTRRSEPAVIVIAPATHDAFAQARIDALRQMLAIARPLEGQKPEQIEPSRLAGVLRDVEPMLRVAQLRAGESDAESIATITDQLAIAQEQLAGGDPSAGVQQVGRVMRDVRTLLRRLEARAALGDALAIDLLAGDVNKAARERLVRDLRDRLRLLEIRASGRQLTAALRDAAGGDESAKPVDLLEWHRTESPSRERFLARVRSEALRERPNPQRLRTLRRLGASDDLWTLPVAVEFDEDRRALLATAAGYRLLAMLPVEIGAVALSMMDERLTVERSLLGWQATAWQAIVDADRADDATAVQRTIDALEPLRPASDAAIATLKRRLLPLVGPEAAGRAAAPNPSELRRAREQLKRDLEEVVIAMSRLDPGGTVHAAHDRAVAAWRAGDRVAASAACRAAADAIQRFVEHRDVRLQIEQSQQGSHMRPMIEQLLELARPRAEEMNLTLAAMRMWSMLRERAVRPDPTRAQETDPAGYEESIRLYFNAIDRTRGGAR